MSFNKRKYNSFTEFFSDLLFLIKNFRLINSDLSKDLRHKLMLTVTGVNDCRYCSYVHSRIALINGFNKSEVNQLLAGLPVNESDNNIKLLLYAQHYAETRGNPSDDVVNALIKFYGNDMIARVNYFLRLIKLGNYVGNCFDYLLYTLKRMISP